MSLDSEPIAPAVTSAYTSVRRAQYAEQTRQAILDAARELFRERGYVATRVDDIAKRAQVSPATVYAVGGGKAALLGFWTTAWSSDPMLEPLYETIGRATEPREVLVLAFGGVSEIQTKWSDVIRVVRETAPHDAAIRAQLEVATGRYHAAVRLVIERLHELSALPADLDGELNRAADILWFYLGQSAQDALLNESGWSRADADEWLREQAARALSL